MPVLVQRVQGFFGGLVSDGSAVVSSFTVGKSAAARQLCSRSLPLNSDLLSVFCYTFLIKSTYSS